MPCNTCVKINPIPECLADSGELNLVGLSVADSDDVAYVSLTDVATGRVDYLPFNEPNDTDIVIELTDFMPLMIHPYEIRLLSQSNEEIPFTLTNPDSTTEEGCCLEFNVQPRLEWEDGDFSISSVTCAV